MSDKLREPNPNYPDRELAPEDRPRFVAVASAPEVAALRDLIEAQNYFLHHKGLWEEFADSFARDRTHDWFYYDGVKGDCCRRCGIVRRADRMNNPCNGNTNLRKPEK